MKLHLVKHLIDVKGSQSLLTSRILLSDQIDYKAMMRPEIK